MAGLDENTPTPTDIIVHRDRKTLEVAFDDGSRFELPFEFLRVDCYLVDGPDGERLHVGELTNYPGAGFERFIPARYARELGVCWSGGAGGVSDHVAR